MVREYGDLPRIEAYTGELNQVWTNLIDNAVDAMKGSGTLCIHTFAEGNNAVVEITSTPGETTLHVQIPIRRRDTH